MKKILSLILAGLMTVSCAAFVAADDAAVEATTDPVQDYAIEFLANCGVFKGGEGLTNEDLIQRYQMALFVSRISTGWVDDATWEDGTANDATFKDIDTEPANKYLGALSYANQNGIIEGYTANTFAPYASITYRDALTMVVRTLGYKGLSYPWGNIEKAVELGLTEGVDAAYTDELTRGEVAVIIYNAMFAKNSKGETLAKSIFGYDYGFQNIVIVSTDEYGYAANGDRAAAGYVGFKTIDENGVLGSKVYYVKASEFGFEGHEEELAVGEVFVALFEIDGDYTNMIDVASLKTATVMNNGITDNEGKAYETMPIAAALADYTLVKDYTKGILNYTYEDLRVYAYGDVKVYDADGHATWIGIDAKSNIVQWNNTDSKWEIAWYYNSELDRYYNYVVKTDSLSTLKTDATEAISGIAIDWMSDAEFTEWYNEAIRELVATYSELQLQEAPATAVTSGKAPYAKLNLFDIDNDDKAEVATYKSYSIGIFTKDTANHKCTQTDNSLDHSAGVVMPRYEITDLEGNEVYAAFVEAGHEKHDVDDEKGFAWLNVDPSVTTFDEAKGGVVLYNVNKTTGEIEIVKHITEGTNDDADSKIITGVLQAYSTKNETVTIDGTVYPIDYDNLSGDVYAMDGNSTATRKLIAADLDAQYMQYITAVVCDGYVVDTDLRGSDTDSIVVLGYAGITSDGYIAVYGYKTDVLKLEVFKINSYNGWKKGDYRYYPENAEEDDAFEFGALYTVKSFDKETNSYGVYTENVETVLENAVPVRVTFKDGYRVVQPMDIVTEVNNGTRTFTWTSKKDSTGADAAAKVVAMSSADKYVIVNNNGVTGLSSNIFVYDGIVDDDNAAYGIDALLVGALDSKTLVLYTLNNLGLGALNIDSEFDSRNVMTLAGSAFTSNAYDVGYVVYEKANGFTLDAAYDEAIGGTYLLGSTLSEVSVFNLLTGKRDVVLASSNIDLVNGHVYKTIGNQILWDVTDDCGDNLHDFIGAINSAYNSHDIDYADYIVDEQAVLTKDTLSDLVLAIELGLVTGVAGTDAEDWIDNADGVDKALADALIDTKTIYLVTDEWTWSWGYEHNSTLEIIDLKELAADTTYTAALVYDVAGKDVVIYIMTDEDGVAGDGLNVSKNALTEKFTGKFYNGSDKPYTDVDVAKTNLVTTGDSAVTKPMWKLAAKDATEYDRYFDLQIGYEILVTYANGECTDVAKIELLSLDFEIVELTLKDPSKAWDKSTNPWQVKTLEDCESKLHTALANAKIGFGHIDGFNPENIDSIANLIDISDFMTGEVVLDADDDDIDVKWMEECGLVYGVSFDLEETVNVGSSSTPVWKNIELNDASDYRSWIGVIFDTNLSVRVDFYLDVMEIIDVASGNVLETAVIDSVVGVDVAKTNTACTFNTAITLTEPNYEENKTPVSLFN